MSINVALINWRFLYKLQAPAVRYFGGSFGWSCNIRQNMVAGSYHPPLDPDKPTVLTFYLGLYSLGLYSPGRHAGEQGNLGREKMLNTSYDVEQQIRSQMALLTQQSEKQPPSRICVNLPISSWRKEAKMRRETRVERSEE